MFSKKYQLVESGYDPVENPPPKERRRFPWIWIGLLALILACLIAGAVGLTRKSAVQADSLGKVQPTPSPTWIVEVSSNSRTPTQAPTSTGTQTPASTQTARIITQIVERNVEVIRITVQLVDKQIVVPQDRAVIVTVKVPWVITQVITTTPMPSYTPYPTYTVGPSQTPWVVTVTPIPTETATLAPPPTETPTITVTPTIIVIPTDTDTPIPTETPAQ